jgi:RimJ/RimL family protein N-acetyltransferase
MLISMQDTLISKRLLLTKLSLDDADFIFELVNSPGWLKFIGDRNVKAPEDARLFILKILNNPSVNYWIVRVQEQLLPIGVVSFIKRDYLDFHDIGFAFLPKHSKQGYAYEAAVTLLQNLAKEHSYPRILATTIKENSSSISLLEKMGFHFDRQIVADGEELSVYSISMDKFLIDHLTNSFFKLFSNIDGRPVNLDLIFDLCLVETIIIKKSGLNSEVYNLRTFIEPRQKILSDGTLTSFEEREVAEETKIIGGMAQRFSRYDKKGCFCGKDFKQSGNKFFQFVKTTEGWKMNAVIWEDDEN